MKRAGPPPEFWRTIDTMELAKKHLYQKPSNLDPDPDLYTSLLDNSEVRSILDFGAGIGKNTPTLLNLPLSPAIYAFELPGMIKAAQEHLGYEVWSQVHWIPPPIENLNLYRFDRIIASYVFQHIPEPELVSILQVLHYCLKDTGLLRVISRWNLDDGVTSVWPLILTYFKPVTPLDMTALSGDNHQTVTLKKLIR